MCFALSHHRSLELSRSALPSCDLAEILLQRAIGAMGLFWMPTAQCSTHKMPLGIHCVHCISNSTSRRRKAHACPLWHHWPRRRWHHSRRHCLRAQSRCHSEPWPQDVTTALSRLFACITVEWRGQHRLHCCVFLVDLAIRQMQLCCNALSLGWGMASVNSWPVKDAGRSTTPLRYRTNGWLGWLNMSLARLWSVPVAGTTFWIWARASTINWWFLRRCNAKSSLVIL